jgi:hypothetical protein
MQYATSQHATGKNSPPTYDIVGKHKIVYDIVGLTYDVVCKTYDVVYDVTYDVVGATGKTVTSTCDVVGNHYIVYDIVG